jgi:hypothetical protein
VYRVSSLLSTRGKYGKAYAVLFLIQYPCSEGKECACDADIFFTDTRLWILLDYSSIGFMTILSMK